MQSAEDDKSIIQFKVKRLIRYLDEAKGDGTSMISVIIPPTRKIADVQKQLVDEFGKAEHIKDRVNKQSVQGGITSAKEKLKSFNKIPKNGLVIYCGTILAEGSQTKKLITDFEPHKPINTTLYNCGNHFITQPLKELLESDEKYGFVVVDGNGALWATVQGNSIQVVSKMSVDLPKKHGRGGQSSNRFANTREEKRAAYVKKVCETTNANYINMAENCPNIAGMITAGYADFKTRVADSPFLDPRLKKITLNVVDVSYGGDQGLQQAIELSKGCLANIKLVQEQQLIGRFYEQINIDHNKIIYSIEDTMKALEDGVIKELIVFDDLDTYRVVLKNSEDEDVIKYMSPAKMESEDAFKDPETKEELELVEKEPFVDWIAENHKEFGCTLFFVTDKSAEGSQFVKGFGGVGGFLRYNIDYEEGYSAGNDSDEEDFI